MFFTAVGQTGSFKGRGVGRDTSLMLLCLALTGRMLGQLLCQEVEKSRPGTGVAH